MSDDNSLCNCEHCGFYEESYDSKQDRQYFQCIQTMKETSPHDECEYFYPKNFDDDEDDWDYEEDWYSDLEND